MDYELTMTLLVNHKLRAGGGGLARPIACELINLIQVDSISKNVIFAIFLFSSFTIDFKICLYAIQFDTLYCPLEYIDDTLSILLLFIYYSSIIELFECRKTK